MFLKLNHQTMQVFKYSKEFASECYRITKEFPQEERFNMISQIRRASLSVVLNIAEGCSRKSEVERKRFFEISRGSIVEIDAAFDMADKLGYLKNVNCIFISELINKTFSMLSKMLQAKK
ncbi:MAG: four helix bundle protein, partial [Chitinophagaceae bacterium]